MGTHMKTTVELSDSLLRRAREVAARDGTTLRALIEAGLRAVLAERMRASRFELRDARVQGRGLVAEVRGAGWERIREAAYEGCGG